MTREDTTSGESTPSPRSERLRVAIAGGGICGALLAAQLDKERAGFSSAHSASQRKNAKKSTFAH